jgi:undecaprenyl-diphosphatase
MNLGIATVLGVVQGLTEFLPISSTAHLRLAGEVLLEGASPGTAFIAVTQLGTMAAVLVYFRTDLLRIAVAWLRGAKDPGARTSLDYRLGGYIALGTIPIVFFGVVFRKQIEGEADLRLIASALIALGLLLLFAERVGRRTRGIESLTLKDGLAIGTAQAAALIPGVSRSGSTLTAGLFLGLERAAAARYSFLLSVPAIVLSGLFELRKIGDPGAAGPAATAIATVVAFISGYFAIAGLLRYLVTHSTGIFVAYRVAVGILVLVLVANGTLH